MYAKQNKDETQNIIMRPVIKQINMQYSNTHNTAFCIIFNINITKHTVNIDEILRSDPIRIDYKNKLKTLHFIESACQKWGER